MRLETPKIFDSELRLCEILWEHQPVKSSELARLCAERLGWKKSTTYTVIKRLTERGVVKTENAVVTALVSRDEVPGFLTAFVGGRGLSAEEAEELRRMIAAFEEKRDE